MSKFSIYAISKDDKFMMGTEIPDGFDCKITNIANNRENLTKVCNKILNDNMNSETDFVIIMHSDVKLDLPHLLTHIDECKNKYDVMGLCGCSRISVSQKPLNWFCGSRPFPESRWGCVTHGELNNQMSFFSHHHPEITDHEVCCIDGLCMIFGRKAIDSDLRFDERLRYNCYDTDISLSCIMKKYMKLGVIVEKSLQHYSVGRSITTEDFQIDEKILRENHNITI